jgi:hypothetical protein
LTPNLGLLLRWHTALPHLEFAAALADERRRELESGWAAGVAALVGARGALSVFASEAGIVSLVCARPAGFSAAGGALSSYGYEELGRMHASRTRAGTGEAWAARAHVVGSGLKARSIGLYAAKRARLVAGCTDTPCRPRPLTSRVRRCFLIWAMCTSACRTGRRPCTSLSRQQSKTMPMRSLTSAAAS